MSGNNEIIYKKLKYKAKMLLNNKIFQPSNIDISL